MGAGNFLTSDGNRVNVGNFDSDGLNVNNNWDDNVNDNIGLSSARKSPLCLVTNARRNGGHSPTVRGMF
jgi:hypothetical protein